MLSIRLPYELEQELATIAKLEKSTKTKIVKEAIVSFLDNLKQKRETSAYTLGEDLFGVYEGDEDLSKNYKEKLFGILSEKHNHN